jgi:ATP-dependent Clp protease ATP-binding subunit ClpA
LSSTKELAKRLDRLETHIEKRLASHDEAIAAMLSAIRELMNPPAPRRRGIGFTANIEGKS